MSKTKELHDLSALVPVQQAGLATRDPERILDYEFTLRDLERAAYPWREAYSYALRAKDMLAAQQAVLRISQVVDQDRAACTMELARKHRLHHVEYLGELPVPKVPTTVTCPDKSTSLIEPLLWPRKETLWIPEDAMRIVHREAQAGLWFHTGLVLHELTPPAIPEASYDASLARKFFSKLGKVADWLFLDPALVGVIKSLPESETGHWFRLVAWVE